MNLPSKHTSELKPGPLRYAPVFPILGSFVLLAASALASDRFVSPVGGHVPPFTDWSTAATNIQSAIDVTAAGETVWVTNGTYASGGKVVSGDTVTNRVALTKALTVRSVNGPKATIIQGYQVPSTTNGAASVRCAWVATGATLSGFTVIGGSAPGYGGGVFCQSLGVVTNCIVSGNSAGNSGGGVCQGAVYNSLITGNTAVNSGGGAYYATIRNSALIGNRAGDGAGAYSSSLTNCTVSRNSARSCGGLSSGTAVNSILFFNSGGSTYANCWSATLTRCFTYPPSGVSGINVGPNDPGLFSDGIHLRPDSPCIGWGLSVASGCDIDGQPWSNPPAVGCDQWAPGLLVASEPRVLPDAVPGQAIVRCELAGSGAYCWWWKDGLAVQDNAHYASAHSPCLTVRNFDGSDAGAYQVVASNVFDVVTSSVVTVSVACVNGSSTNATPPYADWSSAALTIQDAVDSLLLGGVVLVTNGVYDTGGRYGTNRMVIDKAVTVMSLNGPDQTAIEGAWDPSSTNGPLSVRCAWLGDEGVLGGLTLRNGSTTGDGGGVWNAGIGLQEPLIGCVVSNCSAAGNGGGVLHGRLRECVLIGNKAGNYGGGLAFASAADCTISQNSAAYGAGAYECNLERCAVTGNVAPYGRVGGLQNGRATGCLFATNVETGIYGVLARNCKLHENSGTGALFSILQGCFLRGHAGKAAVSCTNVNCTFFNNGTSLEGGFSTNCIAWFGTNTSFSVLTPSFMAGMMELNANPGTNFGRLYPNLLSDGMHLAADSPCIGRGKSVTSDVLDIDGRPFGNPPSIGCSEWDPAPLLISEPRVLPGLGARQAIIFVELAGAPAYCWWTKDGMALEESARYSCAHSNAVLVRDFNLNDAGAYQVMASNSFGVVTSSVVEVNIACVAPSSSSPTPPYGDWNSAAHNIQDAVDATEAGTVVLVTNGIYGSGGRYVSGDMTNRLVLDKPVTVLGLAGAEQTVVEGAWDPVTTNGPASVRCVWLGPGAVLGGFTLRNGSTPGNGGGVYSVERGWREAVVNCVVTNCRAAGMGGGAYQGRLRNCSLLGNSAGKGGGAALTFLDRSLVQLNSAVEGGGVYRGVTRNCQVLGNTATSRGGGVAGLNASALVLGSSIALNQGGQYGGAVEAVLYHCTVVSNRAPTSPYAGVDYATLYNCIVYFNSGRPDSAYGPLFWDVGSCSSGYGMNTTYPTRYVIGITNNPQLLDLGHVGSNSPCVGGGTNLGVVGFPDLDGESWASAASIGCDEFVAANLSGPLSVSISALAEVPAGAVVAVSAALAGRVSSLKWDFGDGSVAFDLGFSTSHAWTNPGSYLLTATAFNNDHPAGVSATLPVQVFPMETPSLGAATKSNAVFSVQFASQRGLTYSLQMTTNFTPPVVWQTVQTLSSTGGVVTATDSNAQGESRFYRLKSWWSAP